VVSKCANPDCSEEFRYLRQGKLFLLTPTPDVQAATAGGHASMYERFWLCEQCCKQLTLVWGGAEAKVVPLAAKSPTLPAVVSARAVAKEQPRRRAAHAGHSRG
jgi:hypothetical protein